MCKVKGNAVMKTASLVVMGILECTVIASNVLFSDSLIGIKEYCSRDGAFIEDWFSTNEFRNKVKRL